ncbi:MAG: heparinase II/III family protein, partial [Cytophagaceae bacterium]|nr:heparinase II/III family protein [Cytophagaceae bacterium]
YIHAGINYDWVTNPQTGYRYDINKHWTEIETIDTKAGDIKYVWELSRFSYLYTIIRYDYHFKEDQSEFAINKMLSWIDKNPLNQGPNFACSQELAIRILNWAFALYYYKNAPALTEERFQKIINSIYWQAKHVRGNINFSLITVRNNHALTECLLLYTVGLLFPFFPEASSWKIKGKELLEQEGLYQIYEDGSFLQFSMNYERVVIQLFTWAFYLSKANEESFSQELIIRLKKAGDFLYQHQDEKSGMLPNYGANDGALFFPLNNCYFRDYRPQLNALNYFLTGNSLYQEDDCNEDIFWFANIVNAYPSLKEKKSQEFSSGGYYLLREKEKFSFLRCGNHKDRPSQADNLHLDIWWEGKNVLRDGGSFKYNASKEDISFFMGTASHNTVMIENHNQMLKGGRFLWFHWSQAVNASISETEEEITFEGKIHAYKQLGKKIYHTRKVKQYKNQLLWVIEDTIEGNSLPLKQIWNPSEDFFKENFKIKSFDATGGEIHFQTEEVYYSPTYGVKEKSKQIIFNTSGNYFKTIISKHKFYFGSN